MKEESWGGERERMKGGRMDGWMVIPSFPGGITWPVTTAPGI